MPSFVSFDFDLDRTDIPLDGKPYKNGLDCAQWLIDHLKNKKLGLMPCAVHSANVDCAPKIVELLKSYKV